MKQDTKRNKNSTTKPSEDYRQRLAAVLNRLLLESRESGGIGSIYAISKATGIAEMTISDVFRLKRLPSVWLLAQIEAALGQPPGYVMSQIG